MSTRVYYIPATSEDAAQAVVLGIEAKRIPCLPEYINPALAAANFESYPRGMSYRLWAVERRAVDDGRISNVRLISQVGDLAAALLIVIGGAFAVGWSTLL